MDLSLGIHDVDGKRAGAFVELFQETVDLGDEARVTGRVEQLQYALFESERRGEIGVFDNLAFEARGIKRQAMPAGILQLHEPQLLADAVGREGDTGDQQRAGEQQGGQAPRVANMQELAESQVVSLP